MVSQPVPIIVNLWRVCSKVAGNWGYRNG